MADHDTWHWQEPGTAWKGAGLYHITLTIPSREPLLGNLVIPDNDPKQAIVEYSDFGMAILDIQKNLPSFYPEIQILHYCLMPDHLHAIRYIDMNPQRLATKKLMPGFFRVQEDIEIAGRKYRGIGNAKLLQASQFAHTAEEINYRVILGC